jgi:flagellar hook protein FlgE
LDLAITGAGMFMLAKNTQGNVPVESPSKFEYTRNGQFGTDSENRMVNQTGLFVVGYPADATGNIIAGAKSTLTLDQTPLPSQPTSASSIALNLDNRNLKLDIAFDPTNSTTYSQATSQTLYDQNGNGHILATYYKKISPQLLTLASATDGTYNYSPVQQINSGVAPTNEQLGVIASTYGGEDAKYIAASTGAVRAISGSATTDRISIAGAVKTLTGGTLNAANSTYDLRLSDGTHIPITQVIAGAAGTATYTATVDRFEVYATIDNNKVGHDPALDKDVKFVKASDGSITTQQMSVGTMAFLGGKNIDTLQLGPDGTPVNASGTVAATVFKFNALSASGAGAYGKTSQNGIMQFTLNSDDMSSLTAPSQTYKNTQDGHTVSNLSGYSIDGTGRLTATYDNGVQHVKGQLILAQFGNVDGLMPNGSNTFAATKASGDPILSAPGSGLLGQIRSKALEASNVDLTSQLVQLMVLQRQYSATSQALKLQASTMVDDVINMGR